VQLGNEGGGGAGPEWRGICLDGRFVRVYTDINVELERVVVTLRGTVGLHDINEIVSTSTKAQITSFPALMNASLGSVRLSAEDLALIRESLVSVTTRFRLAPCAVVVSDAASLSVVEAAGRAFAGLVSVAGFLDQGEAERWLGW
jgi:hypothetical protein